MSEYFFYFETMNIARVFLRIVVLCIFSKVGFGQSNIEILFAIDSITTSTASLYWDASPSDFTGTTYIISISPSGPVVDIAAGDGRVFTSSGSTGISGLSPGAQYIVTVILDFGSHTHDITVDPFNAEPKPPMDALVYAVDTNTLNVTWTPDYLDNIQDSFRVYLSSDKATLATCHEGALTGSSTVCMFDVTGDAGAEHTVYVVSKSGESESETVSATGNTKPFQIGSMTIQAQSTQTLELRAIKPSYSVIDNLVVAVVPATINMSTLTTQVDIYFVIAIEGLTPGTNHDVKVTTKSGDETGTPRAASFSTRPAVPTTLNRKSATTNSLVIGWGPPEGNYDSFALAVNSVTVDSNIAANIFEFTISDLPTAGELYYIMMTTKANGLESDSSILKTFSTKPNSPQNMQFHSVTETSFTVTWDAPVGEVTGYICEGIDKPAYDRSHTFTDLEPGTLFTITVISKAYDLISKALTDSVVTYPESPGIVDVINTTTDAITFRLPIAYQTDRVDGYRYVIAVASNNTLVVNTTTSNVTTTVTGLYSGQTYDIKVWTYTYFEGHGLRESSRYDSDKITTLPKPPSGLTVAEKTNTTLLVTWTEPTDTLYDGFTLKAQNVYRSQHFSSYFSYPAKGDTEWSIAKLEPGATYILEIWIAIGDSFPLPIESPRDQIFVTMVPDPPSSLSEAVKSKTYIDVQWRPASRGTFDGYKLNVIDTSNNNIVLDQSFSKIIESHRVKDLSAATTYRVSLIAISGPEISEALELDIVTRSPDSLEFIVSETSSTSIECLWNPGEGDTFTDAVIRLSDKNNNVFTTVAYSDGTSQHIFPDLQPGMYYTVGITLTINGADLTLTKSIVLSPMPVSNFTINLLSAEEVELTWDIDNRSYQEEIVIAFNDYQANTVTLDGSRTSYQLTELMPGEFYEFYIYSKVTHFTQSKTSHHVSETVTTYPIDPIDPDWTFAFAHDYDSIGLIWEQGDYYNITSYKIWVENLSKAPSPSVNEFMSPPYSTMILINDLYPGEKYAVHFSTMSGSTESQYGSTVTVVTYPLPPEIVALSTTDTEITVTWGKPSSVISEWRLVYTLKGITPLIADVRVDGTLRSHTMGGFDPGQTYTVRIFGFSFGIESWNSTNKDVTLEPVMTSVMTEDAVSTSSDEVVISYTEESGAGVFDEYSFIINTDGSPSVRKSSSDPDRVVRFSGLTPGSLYTVVGRTHSGNRQSNMQTLPVLTVPETPTVICSETLLNEITIQVGHPKGGVTEYKIECAGENCETLRRLTPSSTMEGSFTLLKYKPLIPFNSYTFKVSSYKRSGYHEKTGRSVMITCNTVESAPEEVEAFELKVDEYDIMLTWRAPLVRNGIIRKYVLTYTGIKENNPKQVGNETLPANQFTHRVTDLTAGYEYTFTIQAVTVERGLPKNRSHYFPIREPSIAAKFINDPDSMKPGESTDQSGTGFTVRIVNPFTDNNGRVVGYSVIVATSHSDIGDDSTLVNWSESQKVSFAKPYIAVYKCQDLFDTAKECPDKTTQARRKRNIGDAADITIGAHKQCDAAEYCNGELIADTTFYILLRAYTENGLYADTPFSDAIKTAKGEDGGSESNMMVIILASVLSVVVAGVLIGVVIFLVLRSRRKSVQQKAAIEAETQAGLPNQLTPEYEELPDNKTKDLQPTSDNIQQYEEIPIKPIGSTPIKGDRSQYMALDKPIYYENVADESSEYYNNPKGSTKEQAQYLQLKI